MMKLAAMISIEVPEVELIALEAINGLPEGIEHLMGQALSVRRFDRTLEGELIHIEDFAQVFNVFCLGSGETPSTFIKVSG